MKKEAWIFLGVAVFLLPDTILYWFFSHDPTGTAALSLAFGLCLLIGYYLAFTATRIGQRPEDREDADISEGAGELGFFSPHSWWPLAAAVSAALAFSGIVFGWWLLYFSVPFVIFSVAGLVFEYYTGEGNRY